MKWTGFQRLTCLTGVTHHKTHASFQSGSCHAVMNLQGPAQGLTSRSTLGLTSSEHMSCFFPALDEAEAAVVTKIRRQVGGGPGVGVCTKAHMMCTKMSGQPICLSAHFHLVLSFLYFHPPD